MKRIILTLMVVLTGLTAFSGVALAQDPPIYKSIYDRAKKLYEEDKFLEARALFLEVKRMALEDGTYGEMIDYRIAMCYEGEANYKESIKHYTIYMKSSAINDKVASREQVEAKIKDLEAKLAQSTSHAMAQDQAKKAVADLTARGDDYFKKGQFTTALTLYTEVKKLAKQASVYQEIIEYKMALCYEEEKDYKQAIFHYRVYMDAVEVKSGWPSKKVVENRVKNLEKILEREAASTASVSMDAATQKLVSDGRLRYRQNRFPEARKLFTDARDLMQKSGSYQEWIEYYIGVCFEAERKYPEAIAAYKLYVNSKTFVSGMPTKDQILASITRLEKQASNASPANDALEKKLQEKREQARRLVAESKPAEARVLLEQIKKDATAANLYTHKMDWDIAVTYDREGNYKMVLTHYKIYLNAPAIQPGWPDRYTVQNRVQFLQEEQSAKGGGTFSGGGGYYGDGGPGLLGPEDSITGKWWFWVGVAVVGVIVIAVVVSGSQQDTTNDGYKSRPAGFGGDPISGPGVPVLRF